VNVARRMLAVVLPALVLVCPTIVAADGNAADSCEAPGLKVQILGSGGSDLAQNRAGSAYLVWIDGRARVLIDLGPGALLRFAASGARAADLDLVLFTQLHADHTLDLPALVSVALQEGRTRPLPLYGPTGNRFAPSTVTFVRSLLDSTRGVYRHLGDVLSPLVKEGFKLDVQETRARPASVGVRREDNSGLIDIRSSERMQASAAYVIHGDYPALAWRIRVGNRSIVFSGDMNGEGGNLERLAQDADVLVAHHAVTETAAVADRHGYMPPSVIGRIAAQANVKRLVLSHRTRATLGQEDATLAAIRTRYAGPVVFSNDLDCFVLP
jgi:ribonuclease BN (tRNA processing enzyme)